MVEEQIVHLPERSLLARRLARLRRDLRVRVHVAQRQVAPDVAQVGKAAQQLAQHRLGLTTVRTLEVGVLDERDRRFRRATDVVTVGVDVDREVDDQLHPSGQGARPARSREQGDSAEG